MKLYSTPLRFTVLLTALFLVGCSSSDNNQSARMRTDTQKGEYIYRVHDEQLFQIPPLEKKFREVYPWESSLSGERLITKEYFRCKGSSLNPARTVVRDKGEIVHYYDCGGSEKHSLPLREQKEYIYPILIDLVNYLQTKTEKRVVITCGHRCPEHNTYSDPAISNQYSKHMIGAEVSFYVQGLENHPETVIKLIQDYYKTKEKYSKQKEYIEFKRYEKKDTNVSTQPWYNKEIFIKLFQKSEGRNFDNRHPYPYISIQVRYDFDKQENVIYSWDKANGNYLRR